MYQMVSLASILCKPSSAESFTCATTSLPQLHLLYMCTTIPTLSPSIPTKSPKQYTWQCQLLPLLTFLPLQCHNIMPHSSSSQCPFMWRSTGDICDLTPRIMEVRWNAMPQGHTSQPYAMLAQPKNVHRGLFTIVLKQ